MAYRRPGVEIIQQFQAQAPALALPTLPGVIVGPGYQIMDDANVGIYDDLSGTVVTPSLFPYTGLAAGAIVDLADLDPDELESIQKPVSVLLKNAYLVLLDEQPGVATTGAAVTPGGGTNLFNDATVGIFANVTPGEVGSPLFYLQIIDGTSVVAADKALNLIVAKLSANQLKLSREVTAVAGGAGDIDYRILTFQSSLAFDGDDFTALGISKTSSDVSLPANLQSATIAGKKVAIAEVHLGWRAIRPDLFGVLNSFTSLTSLEAIFGVGQVVPANILAYGVLTALDNTAVPIVGVGLDATFFSDEGAAYIEALDFIEDKDVYAIAVLTQNTAVHQSLASHVTNQSASTVGRERIGFINRLLKTFSVITPSSGIGSSTGGNTVAATLNKRFRDTVAPAATFISDGVLVGNYLEITGYTEVEGVNRVIAHNALDNVVGATRTWTFVNGAFTAADVGRTLRMAGAANGANNGDHVIATVVSGTVITTTATTTPVDETFGVGVTQSIIEKVLTAAQAAFLTGTRHFIATIDSEVQITLQNDPTSGFAGTLTGVTYTVTKDLTKDEQASFLAGYSSSFANRRLSNVWPDQLVKPISGEDVILPGYFGGCALVGMVAGLPSQQGFTNLGTTGFTGRIHGKDYFSDDQLDVIAGGGTLILEQDVDDAPLFVRHQLTTDLSTLDFQELSITKNVDAVARFFRPLNEKYIGIFNVTEALLDQLRTVNTGGLEFLKNSTAPRVGGVLSSGSIAKLQPDPNQGDQVLLDLDISVPLPFNNLKITLLI